MSGKMNFVRWFGVFMPLFYIALAVMLVFTPLFERYVSGKTAWVFAGLFFLYGAFRIWRLIRNKE